MARKIPGGAIQANTITVTQLQTTVVSQISAGGGPRVSSLIYPGDDTAANTAGGQTVYITGSGFAANANVYINGNAVPSISFISAGNLAITTPALSSATYPVYVINPEDGATAIHIPGLRVSGEPVWVTSAGSLAASQDEGSAWSYSVSATSDSSVTYALAGGSSLPTGITLAANGLISGTLSSPPGTETTYNFSVIATDAENQSASSREFSVTVSSGEGVLFANNVLLIHADGTNNQNNHTFVDSSNNNLTITRYGNATQGTFSPFSQTGWSNYFDGSGDRLTIADNTALRFGTGDFTIEFWMYPSQTNAYMRPIGTGNTEAGAWSIILNNDATFTLAFATSGVFSSAISYSANIWQHIAIVRSGTTISCFVNGIRQQTTTSSYDLNAAASVFIGYTDAASAQAFLGYMSNVRLVKGTAVYDPSLSTLTVPTSPLTAITNTSLLTCQSNRFVDNSTNAFTITRAGDTSVQAFSPFAPSIAYSPAAVGGSVYFDGSADYLMPANSTATDLGISQQPFTLEWWTYFTTSSGGQYIISKGGGAGAWNSTNGWQYILSIELSSGVISLGYYNGSSYTYWQPAFTVSTVLGRWSHMAMSYDGTNLSFYINGTRIGTTTATNFSKPSASDKCSIGSTAGVTESYHYSGYVSDLRIVRGSAVYNPTLSTLTVPTAPLTNIANTSLLLNFTNAGIFDQTAKNVIETVGDAKVSTSQYKYGTASMYFDGSGDYIQTPSSPQFAFGGVDFTIECWVYGVSKVRSFPYIYSNNIAFGSNFIGLIHNHDSYSNKVVFYVYNSSTSPILQSTTSIGNNEWFHVAVSRSGNTFRLFINGALEANTTYSGSIDGGGTKQARIGSGPTLSSDEFNGYLDDFRITKGYARYTANFTPPTAALRDK
jgi:hypothetical protein